MNTFPGESWPQADPETADQLVTRIQGLTDTVDAYRTGQIKMVRFPFEWMSSDEQEARIHLHARYDSGAVVEVCGETVRRAETYDIVALIESTEYSSLPTEALIPAEEQGVDPTINPDEYINGDYLLGITLTSGFMSWYESRTYFIRDCNDPSNEYERMIEVKVEEFDPQAEREPDIDEFYAIMGSEAKGMAEVDNEQRICDKLAFANSIIWAILNHEPILDTDFCVAPQPARQY